MTDLFQTAPSHSFVDVTDLFAGPGGWDVAARSLGLSVLGIEFDHAACETRRAAGLPTIEGDVREYSPLDFVNYIDGVRHYPRGLIASPPCQTFSAAGKGSGRKALEDVLLVIKALENRENITELLSQFDDERTGLVVEPLRWALTALDAGIPYEWLAFEQVPAVLPVWEAMADVLRRAGYSVATGKLSAEQYGVPQTRKRAILVAKLDQVVCGAGLLMPCKHPEPAKLPAPTHRPYKKGTPQDQGDPNLLPWVSMAQALGWGWNAGPCWTVMTARNRQTGHDVLRGSSWRGEQIAKLTGTDEWDAPDLSAADREREQEAGRMVVGFPRLSDSTPANPKEEVEIDGVLYRARDFREVDEPAFVTTEKARSWTRSIVPSAQPKATVRSEDEPSPTVAFGNDMASTRWVDHEPDATEDDVRAVPRPSGEVPSWVVSTGANSATVGPGEQRDATDWRAGTKPYERPVADPAPTVDTKAGGAWKVHPEGERAEWVGERPATTVQGDPRIGRPGHKHRGPDCCLSNRDEGVGESQFASQSVRVSTQEAAVLQSFPAEYPWKGTRTKQFQQIGNAIPPLLARAILAEVTDVRSPMHTGHRNHPDHWDLSSDELPGMWESADFLGGAPDTVRGGELPPFDSTPAYIRSETLTRQQDGVLQTTTSPTPPSDASTNPPAPSSSAPGSTSSTGSAGADRMADWCPVCAVYGDCDCSAEEDDLPFP